MKKAMALALAVLLALSLCVLALSLCVPALAAEAVTPAPPEWVKAEDYLTFPGDEAYQPENRVEIEARREEARNGAVKSELKWDYSRDRSAGFWYELGLVNLKLAENAGVATGDGETAIYSAFADFSHAADAQKSEDDTYYRLRLEAERCWVVRQRGSASYNWAAGALPILDALDLTTEDFFDAPYMDVITPEQRAVLTRMPETPIAIWLDGKRLSMDTDPEVKSERTMVPIRAVAEAIGAEVEWVQETRQVVMTRAGVTVTMTLDSTTATIDDKTVEMDVAPYATDGRTLIPARYVAEFFGQKVDWDGENRRVLITEDKSVAGSSNLEAWALPMGAMLCRLNSGEPTRFGLYARDAGAVEKCRSVLGGDSWTIPGRDDLVYAVFSMTLYGHDDTFREMAEDVKNYSAKERVAISASSDAWPDYMWEYTEYLDEKWGDRGILAWDLFRMSNLVQWGYTAGYITYEEALSLLNPAASLLREYFSSWDEAYENYLDGYNWWARNDVLGQDIWETERGQIYRQMRETYPQIFDDALFETGVIRLPDVEK